MADKKYNMTFEMTDGTKQKVQFAVPLPQKGVDYFTEADKEEIVALVLAAMTPPVLITFNIDETQCQAEEGMTWAQWCDSEYNTFEGEERWYIAENGWVTNAWDCWLNMGVTGESLIEAGEYYCVNSP